MYRKGLCDYGDRCFKTHIKDVPLMAASLLDSTGVTLGLPKEVSVPVLRIEHWSLTER